MSNNCNLKEMTKEEFALLDKVTTNTVLVTNIYLSGNT